ncbi:MAG: class I SAM-dependent methyltransferase [Deltaproteobacteria bacterium]|nr:class I SAM-dependent methyltransferase [Deltaproteobacteria bacterium]
MKRLASIQEMNTPAFRAVIDEVNEIGRRGGLRVIESTSKLWEYPFCWFAINHHAPPGARILDIGTERSPFPFYLARKGYDVTITDVEKRWRRDWQRAERELLLSLNHSICPAEKLPYPDEYFDIYLSVSVIEHTSFKEETLEEAARVLRPGGLLILTFDMLEEDYGMVYPKEFGVPLSMQKFDAMFEKLPFFQLLESDLSWNVNDIPDFLKWVQSTKPIHRYVMGAAVLKRNRFEPQPRTAFEAFGLELKLLYAYRIAPTLNGLTRRVYHRILREMKR